MLVFTLETLLRCSSDRNAKAHAELDRAVDMCYRPEPFQNDRQRVEYLFTLYEKLTAPLIAPAKKGRRSGAPRVSKQRPG